MSESYALGNFWSSRASYQGVDETFQFYDFVCCTVHLSSRSAASGTRGVRGIRRLGCYFRGAAFTPLERDRIVLLKGDSRFICCVVVVCLLCFLCFVSF